MIEELVREAEGRRDHARVAADLSELPGALTALGSSYSEPGALARQYFSTPEPTLLKFQYDTVLELKNGRDGLLLLPTGSGKSVAAVLYAAASWEAAYKIDPTRTPVAIWICPTVALCLDVVDNLNRRFLNFCGRGGSFGLALVGASTDYRILNDDSDPDTAPPPPKHRRRP